MIDGGIDGRRRHVS